tara:strand:+ start:1485 stop:1934 length:450 start_codon:yes stop_codon:yes gene_type:complete
MGKSKIKSVQNNGTYQSKFDGAIMYTSEVELEDGSLGEVSAKSEGRWKVGDEVEYTLTASNYGNKMKLTKPDFVPYNSTSTSGSGGYQDRQDIILNEWSIGRAMEWEMNLRSPAKVNLRQAIALAKQLKKYALDLDSVDLSLEEVELEN